AQDRWNKMTPAQQQAHLNQLRQQEDARNAAAAPNSSNTRIPPTGPVFGDQQKPDAPSFIQRMWKGFWDTIIPGAKAEELPDNIKQLNQHMSDLNDILTGCGGSSAWGTGLGKSVVDNLFGGRGTGTGTGGG